MRVLNFSAIGIIFLQISILWFTYDKFIAIMCKVVYGEIGKLSMALTEKQIKDRQGKLTASQIGILIRGDESELINLWREVSGDPQAVQPNFDNNWPVQLGTITETLNLNWYMKKYGAVSRRGEVVTHENGWSACTLDGWSDDYDCPIEAKHVIQYKKLNDVLDWYSPQMHWQGYVTKSTRVAASIIIGALEPDVQFIPMDQNYMHAIVKRAEAFMECVRTMTPPCKIPEPPVPVRPDDYITLDYTGDNRWSDAAANWLTNKDAYDKFEAAKKSIKDIMPPNCGFGSGYGIKAKRSKNGAITIKEMEE